MRINLSIGIRLSLRLTLGLGLAFSCSGAQAQTPPATPRAPDSVSAAQIVPADLTLDMRLNRLYRVHEVGIPLSDLLHKASDDDVTLSLARNCTPLKIHLRLNKRPLRQLMQSLAQLISGDWYKSDDGKGYVLRMSLAALSRQQRWWNLFLDEWSLSHALSPRVLQAMRARPSIPDDTHSADGNDEGLRQHLLAGPTFFNLLPPALQEKVANSINDTSWYQEFGIRFATGMDEGAVIAPFADLPASAQKMLQARANQPLDNAYVSFMNAGSLVNTDMVNANGDILGNGLSMDVPTAMDAAAISLTQGNIIERVRKMGRDAPPAWRELAAYQASRVWPNGPPPKYTVVTREHAGILEWLADASGMEFVADYHSRLHAPVPEKTTRLTRPLKEELDAQAAALDLSWKQTPQDIYLFRNNRWYRDDLLEVPAPLLERWLEQYARQWVKDGLGGLWPSASSKEFKGKVRRVLDWQAEVVTTLTPWQIFGGLKFAAAPAGKEKEYTLPDNPTPFKRAVDVFIYQYHFAQLYATLSAEQRTDLLDNRLDFATLNGEQVQRALYIQPLLQIRVARPQRPILLGVHGRQIAGALEGNVRLVITDPTSEQPGPLSGLPSSSGQ